MFQFSENNKTNYELVKEEFLKDLNSQGLILRHKKSGARVVIISNDDDNKVFSIGFRTPPYNDTGLQHIIEHSVLCGSRKYPVKDPFVELCKGSLNTFLNAMTYPDKTVYPVASCNMSDFKNIMDVYMDAVFYPNIYKHREIFMQEGWHYELESVDAPIEYNGVVYNEMKGVYSSADDVLERLIMLSLYPDTAYSYESGGDPEKIPELTYEEFLKYHSEYYHPTNSYIYLYGDVDVNERLEYLNDEYLKEFDVLEKDTTLKLQKTFTAKKEVVEHYAITADEPLENNTYLSLNWAVGTSLDRELYLAMDVLDYVLISSPGGVLKEALIKSGLGSDVDSSYESSIYQPTYSVILHNSETDKKDEFERIVRTTLEEVVKNGIDTDTILGALNHFEFKYREADFGAYPKGLMYGLQIFDSWLYDENEPFMHIAAGDTFAELRRKYKDGYFESLIEKYLLNNNHCSLVVLAPEVGLTRAKEDKVEKVLADYKATLSDKELEELVAQTAALKQYQEEPSSQEELETIPMLTLEDIQKETQPLYIDKRAVLGVPFVHSNVFSNKINYISMLFDCKMVPEKYIEYVGLLSAVLGEMDTTNYTYTQLSNEININLGGLTGVANSYINSKNLDDVKLVFEMKTKTLHGKTQVAFDLFREILFETKYDDYSRLKELISKIKSRLESRLTSAGHSIAMTEASAQFSKAASYSNKIRGYDFYLLIEELDKNFENRKEAVVKILFDLIRLIFRKENMTLHLTSDEEGLEVAEKAMNKFVGTMEADMEEYVARHGITSMAPCAVERAFAPAHVKLGLTSSSQVQYVARCGNYAKAGYDYNGAMRVLKVIFGYEYLWINVRVKGGAYGCMSGFSKNGDVHFVSYRDPNLVKTIEIFEGATEYVRNFDVSDRDMLKFIIGTMGELDTPLTPSAKGSKSLMAYMCDLSVEDFQKERDEILSADVNAIRKLAPIIESVLKQDYMCTVGNEDTIRKSEDLFDEIKSLVK